MHAEPSGTHRLADGTILQRSSANTWTHTRPEVYEPAAARAFKAAAKRDRKTKQRQQLLHRVQDSGISKSTAQKKRRRPKKKLVAAEDLDEMRDALPELSDQDEDEEEWEGLSDVEEGTPSEGKRKQRRVGGGNGQIKMRSLKHRPGAMKRKRKMEGVEMERFGRNLAQLSANTKKPDAAVEGVDASQAGGGAGTQGKWAALRAFIGSTLERKKRDTKE